MLEKTAMRWAFTSDFAIALNSIAMQSMHLDTRENVPSPAYPIIYPLRFLHL